MKLCEYCHQPFEPRNGNQKLCDGPHYKECVVCGTKFEVQNSRLREKDCKSTCSRKCSVELRKRTNQLKYGGNAPACSTDVQSKMRETTKQRFGVEHASQSDVCKEKSKETNLKKYGVDHYSKTEEAKQNLSNLYKDESYVEKVNSNRVRTNQARYGVDNVMQNANIRKRASETYYAKTGYSFPSQNPEIQKQIESTNVKRYGFKRPLQSPEIKDKRVKTNRLKYGVDNPMQAHEIKDKAKNTCLQRYGSTCYLSSEVGKMKTQQRMKEIYGEEYYSKTVDWKTSVIWDPSKIDNLIEFQNDAKAFIHKHFDTTLPTISQLCELTGTGSEAIQVQLDAQECDDIVKHDISTMEWEVFTFLRTILPNAEIHQNTKKIITPYELDLYLPEYHLGIECNPTSTHNCSFSMFGTKENVMSRNYHKMKSNICQENGIFLFHIFGYEWSNKRPIIESMIRNIVKCNNTRIFARNTEIRTVSFIDAQKFLNENHRQGRCNASINLGLYIKSTNTLVALMTFGKVRNTLGVNQGKAVIDDYELLRFCNKLNTSVIGGASKLFSYFCKNFKFKSVRSYSDIAHTRGTVYDQLGFQQISKSSPGYVWVNYKTDIAYSRVKAQKHNLKKFLNDETLDLSKTEQQIMEEHGFVWVYDSGTTLWRYTG